MADDFRVGQVASYDQYHAQVSEDARRKRRKHPEHSATPAPEQDEVLITDQAEPAAADAEDYYAPGEKPEEA